MENVNHAFPPIRESRTAKTGKLSKSHRWDLNHGKSSPSRGPFKGVSKKGPTSMTATGCYFAQPFVGHDSETIRAGIRDTKLTSCAGFRARRVCSALRQFPSSSHIPTRPAFPFPRDTHRYEVSLSI